MTMGAAIMRFICRSQEVRSGTAENGAQASR